MICMNMPVMWWMELFKMIHFSLLCMNWMRKASGKANPALGSIKRLDDLKQKVKRAKNNPSDLTGLLTKDFNIRDTVHAAWLTFDDINNESTFNIEDFRGSYAIGGADLSITTDLS